MQYFLLGMLALALGLLLIRGFAGADIQVLARQIRTVAGIAALAGAALLVVRGLLSFALPLAMAGCWLLWGGSGLPSLGGAARKSSGQTSSVTTDHLQVELDHDTGAVTGRVLKGVFRG